MASNAVKCLKCINDLLQIFERDIPSNKFNENTIKKHQNGKMTTSSTSMLQNDDDDEEESKEQMNDENMDELTEEEALRLAMEMSMNEDDRRLVYLIEKEIKESQSHLSKWFAGSFKSVSDKNRAWCNFCRRLHHKFECYRIENGIIQPLSYQFFIQFIALMYGTMNNLRSDSAELSIDQHQIKNIFILSADDEAIKYLRFKDGISRNEVKEAVFVKFESLALDPMSPNEWKSNHVMFCRSDKAPNGLLWTKWHMQ